MSTTSDSSNKALECTKKRSASPRQKADSPLCKQSKVDEEKDGENESRKKQADQLKYKNGASESNNAPEVSGKPVQNTNGAENAREKEQKHRDEDKDSFEGQKARSDCATICAAEALASLTGGRDQETESPCSSKQALGEITAGKQNRAEMDRSARADDRCSVPAQKGVVGEVQVRARREDGEEENNDDDDNDDSLHGSSLTASSSEDDDDDQEREDCAIMSVQMAPELRRSVAHLAQVQMRLDALEKKGARLHRRLELRLGRQRRPHIEQRAAIAQSIPGFWLTAIETFKNNKLGYRISFHFRQNPFFQNKVIVKELHLGLGGSPVSFSNPIVWYRGQSLTGSGEPRRNSRGVYESFFHWFDDHSSPGMDEIAQVQYKSLVYTSGQISGQGYQGQDGKFTFDRCLNIPGSTSKPPQNSNGDECVIISDSDDDQELVSQDREQEDQDEEDNEYESRDTGAGDSEHDEVDSSSEEVQEEEVDIAELDETCLSASSDVRELDQNEEDDDVEVNEEEEEEEEEEEN
ncbi:Testis-specific Y-encoded-like protein 1 [Bagarius yarrelli]|uniref:Testis-specific Y-encoded-like protein 1 n=1 Tax=Bagarius yarrelli TaxID=175774 RepID=A0A556U7Z8_BAGYA|nr:Testis-specific Y-encoded-like protein 1 [Bagarius yarrelli]